MDTIVQFDSSRWGKPCAACLEPGALPGGLCAACVSCAACGAQPARYFTVTMGPGRWSIREYLCPTCANALHVANVVERTR
jgi:hypothetical protein